MEKLKQLDEEQKKQKKITLKIQTHNPHNKQSNTQDFNHHHGSIESPGKKRLLGEFDEEKDDDDNLYLGDDLLLSKEKSKESHRDNFEMMDMNEFITQQTGIRDPFHDHLDPNEEVSDLRLKPV